MRTEILVTGGGGLLGYALKKLLPNAVFVTREDYDLTELSEAKRLFESFRPKRVIHLAAQVAGVQGNAMNNADLFTANVQINTNVLSMAHWHGVSRLISILSSCAFQCYPDRPSSEDDLHVGLPFGGNLGYGYAKRMLDVQTRLFWEQYGCKYSSITPVTMYGPNDNWDLEKAHVIGALIHRTYLTKQRNEPLEVWGNGNAVRQFICSYDVAQVLVRELDSFTDAETMIVAPETGIAIRDLTRLIAETMKFEGHIVFNPNKPDGQPFKMLKSRKFSHRFSDFTFTSLKEGLRLTAEWFCEHCKDEAALVGGRAARTLD